MRFGKKAGETFLYRGPTTDFILQPPSFVSVYFSLLKFVVISQILSKHWSVNMNKLYVLFNPMAGEQDGEQKARAAAEAFTEFERIYMDVTAPLDYPTLAATLGCEDKIMVCGGDGTLSRFADAVYDLGIQNEILYCATGTGNDFLRDIGKRADEPPFRVNEYIRSLPTVTVNGETHRFINGIGFGIDGYCCEVGDKKRAEGKKPNYTSIAINGLLFHYKPTVATVTVDGETRTFKKAWIAPTMFGRFYGGGMMPAPHQSRENADGRVTFATLYGKGKLGTLMIFPSIFKGEHIKHEDATCEMSGHDIKVVFDRPVALQIDGETILGVTEYAVKSAVPANVGATV